MGTFASAAGGRLSEQKEWQRSKFDEPKASYKFWAPQQDRRGVADSDFSSFVLFINSIFYTEKYSSGRRGVTRNLVGR